MMPPLAAVVLIQILAVVGTLSGRFFTDISIEELN
jgi:hypothetical protein